MNKVWMLTGIVLLSACEYTNDDRVVPNHFDIQDAIILFTENGEPLKKVTRNGAVEEVAVFDESGHLNPIVSSFPTRGANNIAVIHYAYEVYWVRSPSGDVISEPILTSLDGLNDTVLYGDYGSFREFKEDIFQTQGDFAVFRVVNDTLDKMELQVGEFDSSGQLATNSVPNSENTRNFHLSQKGLLAFTTTATASNECRTVIASLTDTEQLAIDSNVFYWVGSSGSLYYQPWEYNSYYEGEIFRVVDEGALTSELVGSSRIILPACASGSHFIGVIDDKTYFFDELNRSIIEFNESTFTLQVLDTESLYGAFGAGTAGDYIYIWRDSGVETVLEQLDPISGVKTEIFSVEEPFYGRIIDDTFWARTWGLENDRIVKVDGLSSLSGMTLPTEIFRTPGKDSFNFIWLTD
ncbi:MAG: hypothetical protein ABJ000_08445 [Saccharospirillum sp.]|uniref:hypothetical protein n=1 Tax=Saccharospirillum sp. TaxID=2033801 RepID=UPI003298DA64